MHLEPHVHAHTNPAPQQTKRFHVEEMRRIPVRVTDRAKEVLDTSSYQSRILPQALSEFFGVLPDVRMVRVDFEGDKLVIDVKHAKDGRKHQRFFIGIEDLAKVSEQPRQGFEAATTADELQRLYRAHVLKEGS